MEEAFQELKTNCETLEKRKQNGRDIDTIIILKVLANLQKFLSEDFIFKTIFSKWACDNNYHDYYNIKNMNKHDIVCHLKMPACIKPEITIGNHPGGVLVKLTNKLNNPKASNKVINLSAPKYKEYLNIWGDDQNYLSVKKLTEWFDKLVTKAVDQLNTEFKRVVKMVRNKCGFTLTLLRGKKLNTFDVDLFPCIILHGSDLLPEDYIQPQAIKSGYSLAPKWKDSEEGGYYWRLTFLVQESQILKAQCEHIEPCVKFLQFLKNDKGEQLIGSYYIKTVVLNVVKQNKSMFKNKTLSYTIEFFVDELLKCMMKRKLSFHWNKKINLFIEENDSDFFEYIIEQLSTIKENFDKLEVGKIKKCFGIKASNVH